jgi:inorganic triphosphatase YgiF
VAHEVELKLEVQQDGLRPVSKLPLFDGESCTQRQVSVYYDTPKFRLRRKGWVLRVREAQGGFVQTIKRTGDAAGLFDREEWESNVDEFEPDPKAIGKTPLSQLVQPGQLRRLKPVCRSDIERSTRIIDVKGTTIELSHDLGSIEGGEASEPINEVELELKDGDLISLFSTARRLVGQAPLKIGITSKSERGFALAEGTRAAPVKAARTFVNEEMSVAEGFSVIVTGCLKHLRMNEPLIKESDTEALHQLRVAVRRLRSALWLFRPAIKDQEFAAFNAQLRRFTRELGAARNIDVILAAIPRDDPARSQLEDNRKRLYAKIIRKLDSRTFRLFVFDLLAWSQVGEWRDRKKSRSSVLPFSVKRLDRLWGRIEKRAGDLRALSDEDRHKLRIDTKKMRYALEFLGELFGQSNQDRASFAKAAEAVQDRLGKMNDLATREELLAGRNRSAVKEQARHLRAAKIQLRKLDEIGPFWRQLAN